MPKTEEELFKTLYQMSKQRMTDYQAGWKAGYAKKEKEIMEQAEAEQIAMEEALEDYREK